MSESPKRVQLRRSKGWRKPEGAIVVARPTRWGNPWRVHAVLFGAPGGWPLIPITPPLAVALYRTALEVGALPYTSSDVRAELAGRDLACWCPTSQPCHADVLLSIANEET